MVGGVEDCWSEAGVGGGAAWDGDGVEMFSFNLPGAGGADATGAMGAMTGAGGGAAGAVCWSNVLALVVPSSPQTGQATVNGICPPAGSTSNLYFWPQSHCTFSSVMAARTAAILRAMMEKTSLELKIFERQTILRHIAMAMRPENRRICEKLCRP